MASLREAIFQFRGDARDLIQEIRKVDVSLKALPDKTQVDIKAVTAKALKDIEKLERKVEELGAMDPDITPHINLAKMEADLARARASIAALPNEKTIDVKLRKADLDESKILKSIDRIEKRVAELQTLNPEIVVDASIKQAEARIDTLRQRIRKLSKETPSVEVGVKVQKANADIALLEVRLDEMRKKNPRFTVDANIASAEAELEALNVRLAALGAKRVDIKVGIDRTLSSRLAGVERIVGSVSSKLDSAGKAAERASKPTVDLSGAFSRLGGALTKIGPLTRGIGIALIGSMLPGILAVIAGLAGAVTAAGALATAFAASLGPAIGLLIPLFVRLTSVVQAYQARSLAMKNAGKDARAQAQAQADAERQLGSARNGVRDANQGIITAERNLKEARQNAAEGLQQASKDNIRAIADEKQAAADLAKAEIDAYAEIKKSIEDVKDARLALAQTELDQKQAKIDTKQAQLNLKQLRDQLGLAGKQFDSTFKKFANASFDLSGLKGALKGAGADVSGGADGFLKLQQALLDVQKAQLGEKEAANQTVHAHEDLNTAMKKAADLQKTGISGVDNYRQAQQRYSDAVDTAATSQKNLNKLTQEGISGNPQVISAVEGLRSAEQNRADALGNLHDAIIKQKQAIKGISSDWQTYQDKLKGLDPAEKRLLTLFIGLKSVFGGMKGATDSVINGIVDGVLNLLPVISRLGGGFKELGTIWGNQIRNFSKQIALPTNILKFKDIFKGTLSLAQTLSSSLTNIFQTLVNVAAAVMPDLISIGKEFQSWTGGLANATADTDKLGKKIHPMVTAFKTFISIGKAIAGVLVNAFSAGAGPINKFLKWIRDAIKGFGNFLKSAKGKNDVSKFFKDTLPFVKSLLSFVGKVIKIIAQLLQFFLPIFKPVLDGFNSLLDIFSAVLGFVDKLIEPFKTLIGYFLSLFVGMGPLGKAVGAVTKIFERFGGGIKGILGAFKGFAGKVKNSLFKPFADAWGEVRKLFQTIGGRLGSAALKIMDGIEKVLKTVFHIITTPYRLAWDAVTAIFAKIKGPLVKAAKAIWDGIKGAFQGVKGFFSRIFGTVIDVIKGTLNGVIGVINIALKGINKITPSARHIGPLKIPGIPDIPLIPKLAAGGITRGATSAFIGEAGPEAVIPLSKSILREIGFGIAAAMNGQIVQGRRLSPAGAGGGGGGMRQIFEKVEVHMSAPGGGVPDPRAAAVMFSRELSRRGG